ncbi:hypothetical protein PENCOP_c005G04750 [Penicillium coprophilum]|uniref:Urea active transporter n=1 Tax=Penicillium coprophilum TaxID=36646 RepID=A0A1V6US83_9EURO|nr:hypothetical protein PENCOP_c005G04750 [Penicillium coprophilum]
MSEISPPLSQKVGYGVVVGLGLSFAAGMILVTRALKRTIGEDNSKVETFIVADRRVQTGLITSAVVSSWLWSTMLLSTTLVTYQYGVSGPFWYGAGCSPMIVSFAYLGAVCKKRIPSAHTVLEIIKLRYGTTAHISFIFLAIINNLFNTINMILGAASAITFLTGMHIMASTFLLPLGVIIYTLMGGIKATFLTDYIHTFIILILCCYLTIKALTDTQIGSIGGLYDLVLAAQPRHFVEGNYQGSLFTMTSQQGIFFGIILLISNFGTVIMDTGYFTKAFAASSEAVTPGYVIGGISYFSIPWSVGSIMGLTMSSSELTNGLALPYAAMAVAGKGGAVATLLMTFMAVTSTLSAQVIAVSSIVAFDLYRTYWNKNAENKALIRWSQIGVVLFGLIAAGLTAVFHFIGLDMGWTLYMIASAWLGMASGIATWLGTAYHFHGKVDISTTGQTLPCMYGTIVSAFTPLLYSITITLAAPDEFEWEDFKKHDMTIRSENEPVEAYEDQSQSLSQMRSTRYAFLWAAATFLGHWVIWPLPMYAAKYIFSKGFFIAWIAVGQIWLWATLLIVGFYPLWDARDRIISLTEKLFQSIVSIFG